MKRGYKQSAAAASVSAATAMLLAQITNFCHGASSASADIQMATSSPNHNLLRRSVDPIHRRMTEYQGMIKLGPSHEEVDIYEEGEEPKKNGANDENPQNDGDGDREEQDQQELEDETEKLKADLAKLENLDAQLRDEIAAEKEEQQDTEPEVTALAEPGVATNSPTTAPPPGTPDADEAEEIAKLKADLAKLENLDDKLKAQISVENQPSDEQLPVQMQDIGGGASSANVVPSSPNDDVDEQLQKEVDKLKADLSNLQGLDAELKDEIAAENQQEVKDSADAETKPSKADDIAQLHDAEEALTHHPEQTLIKIEQRDAIDLAVALGNAVAECNKMVEAPQPPQAQRVEDASGNVKTEAELEVSYEEACCVPPLYSDFCTPTQPREWCDMRFTCLEADRLRTVFLTRCRWRLMQLRGIAGLRVLPRVGFPSTTLR